MLGLFGTLNLGVRSLITQREGTEVTGQNLANVNNPAYARQRLAVSTSLPVPTNLGPQGSGVDGTAIVQLRNALLDRQITSEASVTGSLNAQQLSLQNAQSNLGELIDTSGNGTVGTSDGAGSENGISRQLSTFFSDFSGLAADAASPSERLTLVADAKSLATALNQVASRLSSLHGSLNDSIQSDTGDANQMLSDIAKLNDQIIQSEAATGGKANDLRDLRQQKLENLAKLVDISTTQQPNGGLDVSIGGVTMVSGKDTVDSLETFDAGGGQFMLQAKNSGTPLSLTGGSIQGNIDTRDGALADLQSSVDNLAAQLISQVNAVHSSGYGLDGNTGLDFFTGTDAASIRVNSAIAADPSKVQASSDGTSGDSKVALAISQLANKKISALGNQTFSQSFSATVANLGQSLSTVNDQIANHDTVNKMLSNQRDSVSGVSLDEEMTNLLQYQKAFEASAKLIATVGDMLETVVNMAR